MRLDPLQAGRYHLCQVALAVLLSQFDRIPDVAGSKRLGDCRSEITRLFASGSIRHVPLEHYADGPNGLDGEQYNHALGHKAHVAPQLHKTYAHSFLPPQKEKRILSCCQNALLGRHGYRRTKFTVTVAMTGTGSLFKI